MRHLRISGISNEASAYAVAEWAIGLNKLGIVLCSSQDDAVRMFEAISTFAKHFIRSKIEIYFLPTWDQSPYSPISPSIKIRNRRIQALAMTTDPKTPRPILVITTLPAARQATVPKEILLQHTFSIDMKKPLSSSRLIEELLRLGYRRSDPVEDPGSFAHRGDIVDVYCSKWNFPIRIEFFDEQIESLRFFASDTQISIQDPAPPKIFSLCPAQEVIANETSIPILKSKLKSHSDEQGIPRKIRDPFMQSIQHSFFPPHFDAWAAFCYEKPSCFLEYFSESEVEIVLIDEQSIFPKFDEFITFQKEQYRESILGGQIFPLVENMYPTPKNFDQIILQRTKLFLDPLEFKEGSSAANIKTNEDLSVQSKQNTDILNEHLILWNEDGYKVFFSSATESQQDRVQYLLKGNKVSLDKIQFVVSNLQKGFRWPEKKIAIVTATEILGYSKKVKRNEDSSAKKWSGLQTLSDLSKDDPVVHTDHGIGCYRGLVRLNLTGADSDFLLIEYANQDRLYLPVHRLNIIQKYQGGRDQVRLDKLGGQQFEKTKDKVKKAIKKLAVDLVELYAKRAVQQGDIVSSRGAEYESFESKFPFEPTEDQQSAIDDTLSDLESGRIMDRLICGDVGFGKTEVAMRAAFQPALQGRQVAILVPTTILCHQHEQSFKSRFKDYPINIDSVSRFKSTKMQKETLANVATGNVDILIGTHRLLSKDVHFKDLALIIVDEEHRFGVEHKEKLKALKTNSHVLTLTATPIPRTLHMALSGMREISLMTTPPVDRLPIRTYVSRFDENVIERGINFELARGGQVFFLHNRVESINETAKLIQGIVPKAKVGVAHGQLSERELEKAMISFYQKKTNVLLCTTIIESGLDIPSANTIIINRADTFGLAQLYQLRGRVGRSENRAYAYLLLSKEKQMSNEAKRRLEVIQRFVELGSGFNIASHDLEIRGGGNLLGPQQSGHIAAVGFDLYTELLEEAIHDLKGEASAEPKKIEPEIKVPFPAFFDENYIPDIHQRLMLYRKLSSASTNDELQKVETELKDRFGLLPSEAKNLLWIMRLRLLLQHSHVTSLTVGKGRFSLLAESKIVGMDLAKVVKLVSSQSTKYRLTPDSKLVVQAETSELSLIYFELESLLKSLARRAEK